VTRHARAAVLVVALGLVAYVSSALTSISDSRTPPSGPLPALIDGLPSDNAGQRQQFAERVRTRFPLGFPERDLMLELWREGFEHPGADGTRRWASLERGNIACKYDWTVTWSADQDGRLTAIDGEYVPSCP